MMLRVNKIFSCMLLYYGQLVTFLHLQTFKGGVRRDNLLVLLSIKKLVPIDENIRENFVTWAIIDFFHQITNLDVIKGLLMVKRN